MLTVFDSAGLLFLTVFFKKILLFCTNEGSTALEKEDFSFYFPF